VLALYPQLQDRRLIHEVVRRMINHVVTDLVETSDEAIKAGGPANVEDVRAQPVALVQFSETVAAEHLELKHYLRDHVYRHYRVLRMTNKANTLISSMFDSFFARPELLPDEHFQAARDMESESGEVGRARAVADYIAGMTDRYAIVEHERLFDPAKRS
jgi:dGTPase